MTDGDSVTIDNLRDSANGTFVTLNDYLSLTMDVGAITKGWGKGKSKHKYESHGDGGKGKKGKKGKQAKNAEKSKDHDQFDGLRVLWTVETQAETLLAQQEGTPCFSRWTGSIMLSTSADILFISQCISQTASTCAIVHCGPEEDEDGWIFGVEGQEGVQMNFLTTADMARE